MSRLVDEGSPLAKAWRPYEPCSESAKRRAVRASDGLCESCGHDRVFHQIGRGNGVPLGQEYCDDRYSDPCSCSGFVGAVDDLARWHRER